MGKVRAIGVNMWPGRLSGPLLAQLGGRRASSPQVGDLAPRSRPVLMSTLRGKATLAWHAPEIRLAILHPCGGALEADLSASLAGVPSCQMTLKEERLML